jgi:hypothetical protein
MPSWQDIAKFFLEQWRVINGARASFISGLILIGLFIGGVEWTAFSWRYSTQLENKDGELRSKAEQLQTKENELHLKDDQIKFVERQRDDYKAKAQMEELERRLRLLEPRVAGLEPRRLSEEQKKAIIFNARHASGTHYALSIAHEGECGDCDNYATQISFAFHEAGGWDIRQPFVMGPSMKSPKGISLVIHRGAEEKGYLVARALNAAKIEFDTYPVADVPPEGFPPTEIIVTTAPK